MVKDLHTAFRTGRGTVHAVDGVSFSVDRGRTLGIVGESGSGKTVLARSIMGLLPPHDVIKSGTVHFAGHELTAMAPAQLRQVWGAQLSMIFQDPMTALNPVKRVGAQITESLLLHLDMDGKEADATAIELLRSVGIPSPEERIRWYPFQLSGGMRQRVMIAIALACAPRLVLADEPTTGLDVTVQAQILDLLVQLQRERQMAVILVTHDLGVVATRADEIVVMYAGRVVERAPTRTLFADTHMPYTRALMDSIPRLADPSGSRLTAIAGRPPDLIHPPKGCRFAPRCPYVQDKCRESDPPLRTAATSDHVFACWFPLVDGAPPAGAVPVPSLDRGSPVVMTTDATTGTPTPAPTGGSPAPPSDDAVLQVEHLVVEFRSGRQRVQAVTDISFEVRRGETLGLVGESGCGKTTTGRALVQVQPATSGTVRFNGQDLTQLSGKELRATRTKIQMIFQDPISSLNPRRRIRDIEAEPLAIWGLGSKAEREAQVGSMLESVGIDPDAAGDRRPQEFSGGQCQRISIARALMADPDLLICDEPVSALDVSVQAQILNLLADLKAGFELTMVFIAHDLAVVKNVSDRVAVMYLGKLMEVAPSDDLYRFAAHPYTEALLASIPEPDPDHESSHKALTGELPSPLNPPSGCRFRTRCPYAQARCADEEPLFRDIPGQQVACHFPLVKAPAGLGCLGLTRRWRAGGWYRGPWRPILTKPSACWSSRTTVRCGARPFSAPWPSCWTRISGPSYER